MHEDHEMWSELRNLQSRDIAEKPEISPEKKIDLGLAASLYASLGDYANAQVLYQRIGDEAQAAEMGKLSTNEGNWLKEAANLRASGIESKGQNDKGEWSTAIMEVPDINKADQNRETIRKIGANLEKLLNKISRMLIVREEWSSPEQREAFKDITSVEEVLNRQDRDEQLAPLIRMHHADLRYHETSVPFHEDPNYQEVIKLIMEALPNSKFPDRSKIDEIRTEIINQIIERKLGSLRRVSIIERNDSGKDMHINGLLELANYGGNSLVLYGGRVKIFKNDMPQ